MLTSSTSWPASEMVSVCSAASSDAHGASTELVGERSHFRRLDVGDNGGEAVAIFADEDSVAFCSRADGGPW